LLRRFSNGARSSEEDLHYGQRATILVDLSAMASFVFYPLMSVITDVAREAMLEICYAEAIHYFPEETEWNEFKEKFKNLDLVDRARLFDQYNFQSKGVENVFESLNFPGRNDSQPTTLVVVPNFSVERVQRMLNFAADNYSVNREESEWIIGMPPDRPKNGWRYEALWELFNQPSRKRDACTLNFKDILHGLQEIWLETCETRSLVIASVASKAQHLGTFMFLKMHPEVGLVLSEPKQFTAAICLNLRRSALICLNLRSFFIRDEDSPGISPPPLLIPHSSFCILHSAVLQPLPPPRYPSLIRCQSR